MKQSSRKIIEVFGLLFNLTVQADKRNFFLVVILQSTLGLSTAVNLYLDKKILDTLGAGIQGVPGMTQVLVGFTALRFAAVVGRNLTRYTTGYFQSILEMNVYNHINLTCATKAASVEMATVEDPEFKNRYSKIERTTGNRASRLVGVIAELPDTLITLVSVSFVIAVLHPILIIVPIVMAVPSLISAAKNIRDSYNLETRLSPLYRLRNLAVHYLSNDTNIQEIRLLQAKNTLINKYKFTQAEIFQLRKSFFLRRRQRAFIGNLPNTISNIGISLYSGLGAIAGRFTLGTAFTLTRAADQLNTGINQLFTILSDLYENHLYITDIKWLLSLPEKNETQGTAYPNSISSGFTLRDVWFKYPRSNNWIIKGLNISISPKQTVAIVGENGAGKSTLVKLLSGLYEPTKGEILLDGVPVSNYRRDQYWKKLAVMFQDVEVYGFSATESIGVGDPSKLTDPLAIESAAKFAHIHEWIDNLPKKYATPLISNIEFGTTPSGGQKQRLALARTVLKNGDIVILDEPTSSMDPKAEEAIFNQLQEWGANKLLIFISHRFSTVRQANNIIVIENGEAVETGSHEELMKNNKLYAKLFKLQAKSYQ